MGGGASSSRAIDPSTNEAFAPKHNEPFYLRMELECADFPAAPLFAQIGDKRAKKKKMRPEATTRRLTFRLFGDKFPYACENFRRLCLAPAAEGGYVGSGVHDIRPGIMVLLGRVAAGGKPARNASAFAGRPFEADGDEEVDHGRFALGMASEALGDGLFGSAFYVTGTACENGTNAAAMLDHDDGHCVIGELVGGHLTIELLESLTASDRWMSASEGNDGQRSAASPGGAPAVPVTITSAKALKKFRGSGKWRPSKQGIFSGGDFDDGWTTRDKASRSFNNGSAISKGSDFTTDYQNPSGATSTLEKKKKKKKGSTGSSSRSSGSHHSSNGSLAPPMKASRRG